MHWSIMMNIKSLFITFFVSAFSLTAMAAAESSIDLTPKFIQGNNYLYEGNADIHVVQKMPEPQTCDINYRGTIKTRLNYSIGKVYLDGAAEITATLIDPTIKFSVACEGKESPMNFQFNFDSSKKSDNEMKEVQAGKTALDCLNNTPFVFKVSPQGKVLSVNGVDSFAEKMHQKLTGSKLLLEDTSKDLCTMITPGALEFFMGLITQFLPDHPVNVGDSWEKQTQLGNMNINQNWTLDSAGEKALVIKEKTTITLSQEQKSMIPYDSLSGEETATITLDPKDNWVQSGGSQTEFQGKQSFSLPSADKSLEIETTVTADVTLKRL